MPVVQDQLASYANDTNKAAADLAQIVHDALVILEQRMDNIDNRTIVVEQRLLIVPPVVL